MKYLALDIGKRRTGVAFGDSAIGIALPLSTICHDNKRLLLSSVKELVRNRNIDEIIIGLPLLPSGNQGNQVHFIEQCAQALMQLDVPCSFIDERYTTPKKPLSDNHAAAACAILETKFMRQKKRM